MSDERPEGAKVAPLGFVYGQGLKASLNQVPRVELSVGRDHLSGGITMVAYLAADHGHVRTEPLLVHRWQVPPASLEECLLIAYRGLLAYFEEAGILLP